MIQKSHSRITIDGGVCIIISNGTAAQSDVIDAYLALFSDTALHNDPMIHKSLSLHRIRHFRNEDIFCQYNESFVALGDILFKTK